MTFRLHYRMHEPLERPVFGISLQRIDGAEVTSPNTRDAGLVPERVVGAGFVDLKLDRLPLVPGTYDLSASLVNYTLSHFYDARYRAVRFDVEPGTPSRGIRHSRPGCHVERGDSPTVSQPRQRILVATGDVLEAKMAGPAIRAWQIAIALSRNTRSIS